MFAVTLVVTGTLSSYANNDSGSGSGGEGTIGGTGTAEAQGKAFVWFDEGGWQDPNQNGSKVAPVQGTYDTQAGKWIKGSSGQYTIDFFLEKLDEKITNYEYSTGAAGKGTSGGQSRQDALEAVMVEACEKAVARNEGDVTTARIVGVGVTWCGFDTGKWFISTYSRDKSFVSVFGDRGPKASELKNAYGWGQYVDVGKYNKAQANETWRDYVYRIAIEDNASFGADVGENIYRVYAVAVTDDQPPQKGNFKLKKTSSNSLITG